MIINCVHIYDLCFSLGQNKQLTLSFFFADFITLSIFLSCRANRRALKSNTSSLESWTNLHGFKP